MRRRRWAAVPVLVAAISATPAGAAPSTPSNDVRRFSLAAAGAVSPTLRDAAPTTRFDIVVPHRWRSADLAMTLRWIASSVVPPATSISVAVDGRPWAAAAVDPGVGRMNVVAPDLTVTDHRLRVEIRVAFGTSARRLRGDPAIFVRLDAASSVTLTGRAGPAPLLSDLPGTLVERAGDVVPPLLVALPGGPSADMIEAAAVVAGGIAGSTGFPGTPVRVTIDATDDELATIRGALIRIERDTGASVATVTVRRRTTGESELILAGDGRRLVDAAWTIVAHASTLEGTSRTVAEDVKPPVGSPAGETFRLGPAEAEGPGPISIRLPFRIPTGIVVERAHLRIRLAHDLPTGARVSFRANGRALGARRLPADGEGRTELRADLAPGDLKPGDNTIEVLATTGESRIEAPSVARIDVVDGSRLEVRSRPRVQPALDYWPFLSADDPTWSRTVVSLPADPAAAEIGAVVAMLAEAARWTGRGLGFKIAFDADPATTLVSRNLVALVREPDGAAANRGRAPGTLTIERRGRRALLVAVGARALAPLGSGYYAGRVRGASVVVDERGDVHRLAAAAREPVPGSRWWLPIGLVLAGLSVVFGIGLRRARRRAALHPDDTEPAFGPVLPLPAPRHGSPPDEPLDQEAALEDWLRIREQMLSD